MSIEQVIWTALPKGYDEEHRRLIVSVHVAPRLLADDGSTGARQLGEFEAFRDWPARLSEIRFQLEFNGQAFDGLPLDEPDSELWRILLPEELRVTPHRYEDHSKRNIHVFPVREVLQVVEQAYGALSAAGPALPSIDDSGGPLAVFGPLADLPARVGDSSSFWEELERAQGKAHSGPDSADLPDGRVVREFVADAGLPWNQQAAQDALSAAYRFYHRPGSNRPDFEEDFVEPPPEVPDFDFHEIVALLADHPFLLRRLGLVVDLAVDVGEPLGVLPPTGIVRVVPDGAVPEEPRTPGTRYELDDRWFGARPGQQHLMQRGLINLTREFWDLFQVDVDGAALQSVAFGGTLAGMRSPMARNEQTPASTGAPALRSGGLGLARSQRGDSLLSDLLERRDDNLRIETHHPLEFDAEALVRGYRVDVWDQEGPHGPRWYSLHERLTEHVVDGLPEPLDPVRDEGYVKATAASSEREDHPAPSDDLYLHEAVVSWDGWSLAAPRPGKRIVEPGEGDKGSSVADYDPTVGQLLPIISNSRVAPGTLPRLRLGHTYRLRIRTVDIAGNSRPFSPDDLEAEETGLASEAQMYVRFEPVPSPTVLRRHLDTEGESLEHLVIRSNVGLSAKDYAASEPVKTALAEAEAAHSYSADSQRHLAPPKGSQQMAERDGMFDFALGGSPADMTAALRLALREEGTFLDRRIIDPATGKADQDQGEIKFHPPHATFPARRGGPLRKLDDSQQPIDADVPGAYTFYPEAALQLPYLPDPQAIGVSLTGHDFAGNEIVHQVALFPGDWPLLKPFRIRLSEGPLGLAFTKGVLEARLPQAEVVHGQLSSVFPKERLEHFAIWQWTPQAARTKELSKAALEGRHWMLTPFRRLTLTHAVQQPLAVPDMTKVVSVRALGKTYAEFRGPILNHARSTGRLDVIGAWTEDVDLLTDDVPRMRATGTEEHFEAHAFDFTIGPGEDAAEVSRAGSAAQPPGQPLPTAARIARHEFGDTKYRRVTYHSVATTRFREYLPDRIANGDPAQIQRVEPTELDDGPNLKLVHHVRSTARPAAPEVVQVLPTFRWERDDSGPVRRHVRRGKAVRVWLRRPWFSSGDGELLGVVLAPGTKLPTSWRIDPAVERVAAQRVAAQRVAAQGVAARHVALSGVAVRAAAGPTPAQVRKMLEPYVTKWGSDPVWQSRTPNVTPSASDFPRRAAAMSGLTLDEVAPAARVAVAGHNVQYDANRKLWFCDIEMEMGDSYYPFVRLALARFQPQSVDGAHLSRVTVPDFMQVAPDRTTELSVVRTGFGVTVRGYSGRNAMGDLDGGLSAAVIAQVPRPNTRMRAALEIRPPHLPGDLGWQRVGSEVSLRAASSGFNVTWSGTVPVPMDLPDDHDRRIIVTEIETFERDATATDRYLIVPGGALVRERVVFADTFELPV